GAAAGAAAGAAPGPRPRTGSRSIRGQISGPIPIIPDPMGGEFPVPDPGAIMATPLDGDANVVDDATKADTQALEYDQQQQLADAPSANPSRTEATGSDHYDIEALLDTAPTKSRSASRQRESPQRVTKPAMDQRASVISSDTARARGGREGPRRKKSTFRFALSRLFGRKKKDNGFAETIDSPGWLTPAAPSNGHHRSVSREKPTTAWPPAHEIQVLTGETNPLTSAEPKRSASMPITEFDRALRSHSIGPEDVMAIQSARNSLSADTRLSGNMAAAFDATMTHPAGPHWTEGRRFTGLSQRPASSPRPASSHDRGARLADCSEDPDEIGRAITSDVQGLRRRSRSLYTIPLAESAMPGVARRRSDEIRHWRESYCPSVKSPVSSLPSEIEDVGASAADERETVVEEPPRTPVIPFTFEDVRSMKEVAGPEITEVASLDSRICGLESRVSQLEEFVTQRDQSVPGFGGHVDPPSRAPPSIPVSERAATPHPHPSYRTGNESRGSSANPSTRHSSKMTFGDGPRFPEAAPQPAVPNPNGPTSTTTTRGATTPPPMPRGVAGTITVDHYATLVAMFETERIARETLECQVKKLGHQISLMNILPGYAHTTQSEAPSADRSYGETSVFDDDDDDDDQDQDDHGIIRKHSRLSLRLADSDLAVGGRDGDEHAESFVTRDKDGFDFGIVGDEQDMSAARALSLSRLALGQPPAAMHHLIQPQV
ncbi:Uncharacterized protein TCAP_00341, partial [Tolypocladium capitatum]